MDRWVGEAKTKAVFKSKEAGMTSVKRCLVAFFVVGVTPSVVAAAGPNKREEGII